MATDRRRWRLPLFLSGSFLLSQAFSLPSPVRDGATLAWAPGFHLQLPVWHLIFTPYCSLADLLTVLSVWQAEAFVGSLLVTFFLFLRPRNAGIATLFFIAFVAWGALIPRPMGKLVADDPDTLLIDFHSHSQYSHDGRPSFTPQRNRTWHQLQGYHASFITDHNRIEAAEISKADSSRDWQATGYKSLQGEEVSLAKTHLVILGNRSRVDNRPFDSDPKKVSLFVAAMHQLGLPVIASLPEYWLYHWGEGVQDLVRWGIDGFEIINSAPKALDFPASYRVQIVDLCRSKNLFITGISDNHGYGYATAVWNAVRIPGWSTLDPEGLEKAVLNHLKDKGFNAVQVLERAKFWPQTTWQLAVSPIMGLVVYWRSLQMAQVFAWIAWIWLAAGLCSRFHKISERGKARP